MDIQDILVSAQEYAQAKLALDSCKQNCYEDARYFCSEQYAAVEKAKAKLTQALGLFVTECIREHLLGELDD